MGYTSKQNKDIWFGKVERKSFKILLKNCLTFSVMCRFYGSSLTPAFETNRKAHIASKTE
jgi:hypothetical protein